MRQVDQVLEEARGVAEREEPKGPPNARCKSCGQRIYWATTATGNAMPVTAVPSPDGNLSLRWNGRRVLAVYVSGDVVGPRRKSHFADCPHAAEHRRAR